MSFANIPSGTELFIDANVFVYALAPDPQLGPVCQQFLERIETGDLRGVTSAAILSDVSHRLMTLEACQTYGWRYTGIANRLKRHPDEVRKLTQFRLAIDSVLVMGIQFLPVTARQIAAATAVSQQFGLLSNDALIVAQMLEQGIQHLASHDSDFDSLPGIIRLGPE